MKIRHWWKILLELNRLTGRSGDYIARVVGNGATEQESELVLEIMGEGSDIHEETIRAVLDREAKVKRRALLSGRSIRDALFHYVPRVLGNWRGNQSFTAGEHKVTIGVSATKEFRAELSSVGVEVIGIKGEIAYITRVIDDATELDNNTITVDEDIIMEGEKIKVQGEPQPDGGLETGMGVFFTPVAGGQEIPSPRIRNNTPTSVRARVPDTLLKEREYRLKIVTRYAGSALLNEPRTITYAEPLTTNA
jgi:hypothetical protein